MYILYPANIHHAPGNVQDRSTEHVDSQSDILHWCHNFHIHMDLHTPC